jgi:hypothetical protein
VHGAFGTFCSQEILLFVLNLRRIWAKFGTVMFTKNVLGELFERFWKIYALQCSGVPRSFFFRGGGVQQIQLRTEGRENGDLAAVAP